jgi:hypothetical protein
MFFKLQPHPQSPPSKVAAVEVECIFSDDDILITYVVSGSEELVIPPGLGTERADDLWKTTCFELFLRADGAEPYLEFNFSPSSQWAAYRFATHRAGRSDFPVQVPPHIDSSGWSHIELPGGITGGDAGARFAVKVALDLSDIPPAAHRMGLSAIIEEAGSRKSYWALAHPPGEPDFHHPACFAAQLPPPTRA